MKRLAAGLALATVLFAAPALAAPAADNRAIVTDFFNMVWAGKGMEAFDRYVSPAFVEHNPRLPPGPEGARAFLSSPGYIANKKTMEHLLVDGDLVLAHMKSVGPDGKITAVADLFRLKDGKLVEHWDIVQPMPDNPRNPAPMF